MNNTRKKYTSLMIVTLILLGGCDKFLSENPDNRVNLKSLKQASQLLTNAYANGGYNFTEWMGDNVSYINSTTKTPEQNQAYNWIDFTGSEQDTPTNYWNSSYDAIAHANEVLAVVDDMEGDEAERNAVKGEALLTRAYGHFMLVNLFAKHYDAKTASKDAGIPYVEKPETEFIKKYQRNTVKEVYDFVERDIKAGLKLVDGQFYANSGKYHFTKDAALGLASRFYLFKGDFENCIKYSNQLLGANPGVYVKDIPGLKRIQKNSDDYLNLLNSSTDLSNLLLIRQVTNAHIPNYGYWPDNALYADIFSNPYGLDDLRRDPAWEVGNNEGSAAVKFQFLFERTSLTSNVGENYIIFLAFRGEEVLLNRAESYIITNQLNLALSDLQFLATKRYDGNAQLSIGQLRSYYRSNDDQSVLLNYTLDERRKEFIHEGMRWFDIKRYKFLVEHQLRNQSVITLKTNDRRKVLQIPQAAVDVGGLEQNP